MIRNFLLPIVVAILMVLGVMLTPIIIIEYLSCRSSGELYNTETKYVGVEGCYIKQDGKWVSEWEYRLQRYKNILK